MNDVRILLVDDDEEDYELTRRVVRQIASFRTGLHWEKTYERGLRALREHGDDVCLLDYHLGPQDGLSLLAEARQGGCQVPIIFLTGCGEGDTDDLALRGGADDYLAKAELTATALARSIRYALDRARYGSELRESEQRYRRIVETTNEGVWIADSRGITTFVNGRTAELLGRPRAEVVGRPLSELVEDPAEGRDVMMRRPDGSEVWVSFHGQALYDAAGAADGVLLMLTDVTQRRRAEVSLRATEEQLRHAQKMEAIGALAGGVAHDFNNLLSVIISYAELIRKEQPQGSSLDDDMGEITRAAYRAAELTAQLLAFGRKQMLQPRIVDIAQSVRAVEKMLRRVLKENIELVIQPRSAAQAFVDPTQMDQILLNLAANAADAMPDGGKLTIETMDVVLDEEYAAAHLGVKPGRHLLLAVTDTGVGIPKDVQDRIFEPFFTTKAKGKGTGLGLATVYGIVQQSGAHVWFYSEVGKGTTFKMYFPAVRATAAPAASEGERKSAPLGGGETVVLVEDEEGVRNLACRVLRRAGYVVLDARDGAEALAVCARHQGKIDLLLTDVVMPHMSGREVAERLCAARAGLKVLFMSGYTDDAIVHNGLLDPGVNFLQKPLTPTALLTKLRAVLDAVR